MLHGAVSDLELVLQRYRESTPLDKEPAREILKEWRDTLGENGVWPDVIYEAGTASSAPVMEHLQRIENLAISLTTPGQPLYGDEKTRRTIDRALDWWITERPRFGNWWFNEIGVPMQFRDILIFLPDLDAARRKGALEVLNQLDVKGTGANLVWSAGLAMHYGCLAGDAEQVARMSEVIAGEIKLGGNEGIQVDYSFHQHGARLQQFHYGGAFLSDTSRLAWQLRGTPWAFPRKKVDLLADMALEGSQWMARGVYTVPATMDRSVSRPNSLAAGDLRRVSRMLGVTVEDAEKRRGLERIITRLDGQGPALTGFRHFPESDFTAYHRPEFSLFIKTISTRTLEVESINGENQLGNQMHRGDAYLLRDGGEYHKLQPVWDWALLPGVTTTSAEPLKLRIERRPFVGGLGDGSSGLAAMDYRVSRDDQQLAGRKFWAAHDDAVVCLIGGLRAAPALGEIRTALDQCRLRGEVTLGIAGAAPVKVPAGEETFRNVSWIHHHGVAYLLPAPSTVTLKTGPVSGSWRRIHKSGSTEPVEDQIFLPVLEHGTQPEHAATGYVLAYCPTPEGAQALAGKMPWSILENSGDIQAVRFADGTQMAAFYKAGTIGAGETALSAKEPALLMRDVERKVHRTVPKAQ